MKKPNSVDELLNQSTELLSLRGILDHVGAYIYSKDLEGKYTFANALVCELFGCEVSDILGKDDSHFFDLDASNDLRLNDRRVMDAGITVQREEITFLKATGITHIYWTVKAPVFDENQEVIGMCGISTDITEHKRLESSLARESELLKTVLNNVDALIYMKDKKGRYVYINPKVEALLGTSVANIVGHTDKELLNAEQYEQVSKIDSLVFSTMKKQSIEESFPDLNGRTRHFWSTKLPLPLANQEDVLIGISTEVTELHDLRDELERQATTDVLTGIYNRRFFYSAAEKEFDSSNRYDQPTSLLMLDIDHFKNVNDEFGHIAGDEVLKALALHCTSLVRSCDIVGRIGGEEFAILLPQTDEHSARILAERICLSFDGLVLTEDPEPICVTVSIGVACRTEHDHRIESLFSRADTALYQAKRTGRNKVCVG